MSIEFWIGLISNFIISELLNLKSMNIVKIVIAGVGTIMWGLSENDL